MLVFGSCSRSNGSSVALSFKRSISVYSALVYVDAIDSLPCQHWILCLLSYFFNPISHLHLISLRPPWVNFQFIYFALLAVRFVFLSICGSILYVLGSHPWALLLKTATENIIYSVKVTCRDFYLVYNTINFYLAT